MSTRTDTLCWYAMVGVNLLGLRSFDPFSGAFAKFVPAFSNACLASGGDASHLQSATDLANAPFSVGKRICGLFYVLYTMPD